MCPDSLAESVLSLLMTIHINDSSTRVQHSCFGDKELTLFQESVDPAIVLCVLLTFYTYCNAMHYNMEWDYLVVSL